MSDPKERDNEHNDIVHRRSDQERQQEESAEVAQGGKPREVGGLPFWELPKKKGR